ncbi:MAG: 4-(cytidine 5'-diphospho)-2-C-methyl-D-erythritol kinase [Clostridia bacterium]|nr:4-(cytidine 5'-diphospho)-2-C-methyl-D-erythritol kinase [Clostridia bacterium]
MITKAFAKVNLTLSVQGKRTDGYHELAGIMHEIGLCDEICITPASLGIQVKCAEQPGENNTAYKAAYEFMQAAGIRDGLVIDIEKNIPSQAGLGGASADAAAVLRSLNELYGYPVSQEKLFEIGKSVGADVPFCLHGGCAYAGGIGEKLSKLTPRQMHITLVQGEKGIATKELFSFYDSITDCRDKNRKESITPVLTAWENGDFCSFYTHMFNSLERAAFIKLPELAETKKRLIADTGASAALMTGSGSVIYGIYEDTASAENAAEYMRSCGYRFACVAETKTEAYV